MLLRVELGLQFFLDLRYSVLRLVLGNYQFGLSADRYGRQQREDERHWIRKRQRKVLPEVLPVGRVAETVVTPFVQHFLDWLQVQVGARTSESEALQ